MAGQPDKKAGWWKRKSSGKKALWVFGGVVVILIIIIVATTTGGREDSAATTTTPPRAAAEETTPTASEPSTAATTAATTATTQVTSTTTTTARIKTYSDGTYLVGTDIPAGLYKSATPDTGYWQIAKDATGTLDSIIVNDNTDGQFYVKVTDGQYLTLSGVTIAAAGELKPAELASTDIPPGVYLVGTDIEPGTYKGTLTGGVAYWQVSTDPNGALADIKANANPTGPFYVEVTSGQYLKVSRATITLQK